MPLGRHAVAALIALPVLALLAGLATMGAHAQSPPAPTTTAGACTRHALKYGVSDDPAEAGRQGVFEQAATAVTAPAFYRDAPPATPTLHAASHGSVVVFYRPDLPAAQVRPLRALAAAGQATKTPVIVAPRRQAGAITALALGRQLDCTAADAAQTTDVRAFAAAIYPSLQA